jgi:uncharacterized membrane protein
MARRYTLTKTAGRIQFIDFTRGLAMIVMAWDHVSGFWNEVHGGIEGIVKVRQANLDLLHFLSRFITHFCAPTFIFLAGTSIALMSKNRKNGNQSEKDISLHLLFRGLLLILLDFIVVATSFDLPNLAFGVLACIGVCMIMFSFARRLPSDIILLTSVLIILNHEFIDLSFIPNTVAWGHYLRVILHEPGFEWIPYVGFYPVIPWIGVMGIGYCFGLMLNERERKEIDDLKLSFTGAGVLSIGLFVLVRYLNNYGNLVHRFSYDLMDWLFISKYPPSIAFLLWSLGIMCLLSAFGMYIIEKGYEANRLVSIITLFGRNPLFFYLVHLWLYRFRAPKTTPPVYLTIPQTLIAWSMGLITLWFLTKKYAGLKAAHPNSLLRYI